MNPYKRFTSEVVMSRGNRRRATCVSRIGKGYSISSRPAGVSGKSVLGATSSAPCPVVSLSRIDPFGFRPLRGARVVGFHAAGSSTYNKNDCSALRNLLAYASKLVGLKSRACRFLNLRMRSSTSSPVMSISSQLSSTLRALHRQPEERRRYSGSSRPFLLPSPNGQPIVSL